MITLAIEGMSCGHCVAHVQEALRAVPGVTSAEVDLAAKSARVEGSAPASVLLQAVEAQGYAARET